MVKKNGKLNNAMRKGLVDVVEKKYGKMIENAREEFDDALKVAYSEACDKVGLTKIQNEYNELRREEKKLHKKLQDMGWTTYGHLDYEYIPYSNVKKYKDTSGYKSVQKIVAGKSACELEKEKTSMVAKIWLCTEITAAQDIIDKI